MKLNNFKTWRTIAFTFVMALLIFVTAGGSLAYFTDYQESTNVFTAGNVYIRLSEAAVKADSVGNLIKDPDKDRIFGNSLGETNVVKDYGKIYPGQKIYKDPTIENTGDDGAWIAAKVIISDGRGDLHNVIGYEGIDAIDIEGLLGGGLLDEHIHVGEWNGISNVCHNDNYAMVQVPNRDSGTYEFYFFMLKPTQKGDVITLFGNVSIPPEWDNVEMQELIDLQIKIQAFAVQTFGFSTCFDAMKGAFSAHFNNCVSM